MVQTFLESYQPVGLSYRPPKPLRGPIGPIMGPKRAHMAPNPRSVSCCPTIKCHTIFHSILPKIHWAYTQKYTGLPGPHMSPLGAHMGTKPKIFSFGPTIKCHNITSLTISQAIQWAYSYTYTRAPHRPPCFQGAHRVQK